MAVVDPGFLERGFLTVPSRTSFVDQLCFMCLMFFILLSLFIAVLWSPVGKGLTYLLLLVIFIVFLLLSHVISWVRFDT